MAPEAAWHKDEDSKVPEKWPEQGEISFDAYQTRYRSGLDLVLRKIDITTRRGEKIGIVGRTGAFFSSLVVSILRVSQKSGKLS